MVERGILVGDLECRPGAIDPRNARTMRGQMEGESALVGEDIECLTVGILGRGGIVFALVKEGSGLLAFESFEFKLDAVHGKDGGTLLSPQQARGAWRQFFELADTRIHAL